jgi:hypothetical protein
LTIAEVKDRVEVYFYFPSGLSRPVVGRSIPLPFTMLNVKVAWGEVWCDRNVLLIFGKSAAFFFVVGVSREGKIRKQSWE